MYQGRNETATIILEAVASGDLWIWHAFFGTPGSYNDINVLQRSYVFDDIYHGCAPKVSYNVNGHNYNMGYYLTDGIYPNWGAFIPTIKLPQTPKEATSTRCQEAVRKDVERTFEVLQAQFAIIQHPALAWDDNILWKIMNACIIMHNIIVEDERDTYRNYQNPTQNYQDPTKFIQDRVEYVTKSSSNIKPFTVQCGGVMKLSLVRFMERRNEVMDNQIHYYLQRDLEQHIWANCQGWD